MLSNRVKIDNVEIDLSNPGTEMEKSVINEIQEGFGQLILSLKCPFHNRAVAISVQADTEKADKVHAMTH